MRTAGFWRVLPDVPSCCIRRATARWRRFSRRQRTRRRAKNWGFPAWTACSGCSPLTAEHDDHNGTAIVTATDAARAELQDTVTLNVELESATAIEAARQILAGRGWRIEGGGGRSEKVATGYTSAWAALSDLESTHEVRVLPGYAISGGVVMGRRLVVAERTSTFSRTHLRGGWMRRISPLRHRRAADRSPAPMALARRQGT